jgi:hypothetical protein
MQRFIKIQNSFFYISDTFVGALKKYNLSFELINYKGKESYSLNDSCLAFFTPITTASATHFYVKIRGSKKIRVNKHFYDFLVLRVVEKPKRAKSTALDKFYTKPEIAEYCVGVFSSNVEIKTQDLIVEPSAGSGSFIKMTEKFNCNKIFLDIAPENKQIKQANFLE